MSSTTMSTTTRSGGGGRSPSANNNKKPSFFAQKLTDRLSKLATKASKESVQTLSRWMGFHRRHSIELCHAMHRSITIVPTIQRKVLYLNVVHELLISDCPKLGLSVNGVPTDGGSASSSADGKGNHKWERNRSFRQILGQKVVLPSLKSIRKVQLDNTAAGSTSGDDEESLNKVTEWIDSWQSGNVFVSHEDDFEGEDVSRRAFHILSSDTVVEEEDADDEEERVERGVAARIEEEVTQMDVDSGKEKMAETDPSTLESTTPDATSLALSSSHPAAVDGSVTPHSALKDDAPSGADESAPPSPSSTVGTGVSVKEEESLTTTATTSHIGVPTSKKEVDSTEEMVPPKEQVGRGVKSEDPSLTTTSTPSKIAGAATSTAKSNGNNNERKTPPSSATTRRRSSARIMEEEIIIDFDKEGVEEGPVQIEDILSSCRSIATAQIAREIRSDAFEVISNTLSKLPKDVADYINTTFREKYGSGDENLPSKEEVEMDGLTPVPDELLDMDLDRAMDVITQLQSAIKTQLEGREECIRLLLRSRCKFGSNDVAREYYDVEEKLKRLRKRKVLLSDAMELEGFDMDEMDTGEDGGKGGNKEDDREEELPPLDWFLKGREGGGNGSTPSTTDDKPVTKRAKIN